MNVKGSARLDAPRADVFAAICDPSALLEVIPGCSEISQVAADEYHARISLRLPAMVGSYDTVVRLVNTDPPASGELEGRVEGKAGGIRGRATFRLAEDAGGTLLEYEGTATISGPLARLDSRFVEGLAESLIDQGIARLGKRLARVTAEVAG